MEILLSCTKPSTKTKQNKSTYELLSRTLYAAVIYKHIADVNFDDVVETPNFSCWSDVEGCATGGPKYAIGFRELVPTVFLIIHT